MNRKQFVLTLFVAIISGVLGGALSVWFLMPPSVLAQDEPPKVITAERLEIVDENGVKRLIAEAGGIALVDENGKGRVGIWEDENEDGDVGFFVYDEQQNPRIYLGFAEDGDSTALQFYNSRGEKNLQLTLTDDASVLNLSSEVLLGAVEAVPEREEIPIGAGLYLVDKEGNGRVAISIGKSVPPGIAVIDENGKSVWSAP